MRHRRHVFRQEGEYWTLVFAGKTARLRDVKGLRYLGVLLRHPGKPLHSCALVVSAGRGRSRPTAAARETAVDVERARLTVTKGIKTAIARIAIAHPALAEHLAATVRRGYFCSYMPDPRVPISWAE